MGAALRGEPKTIEATGTAGTNDLVLDIPPEPEHARTARLFAAATARHFELDPERVEDLKVAISEAVTNAIKAHASAGVEEPIHITVKAGSNGVRFDVSDVGAGFDARKAIRAAEDYAPTGGLSEGSLGLALIRSLFPDMEITRNADRGMTISITAE